LRALHRGWGNATWSADLGYLLEVARQAAAAREPILECGSGLTTLLLGALAGRRGIPVWTLEHDPRWHARMERAVRRFRLPGVELRLAPLCDYGRYSWYEAPLPGMPARFGLVICDGPPGDTPGGRYGVLPVLASRLAGAVVLLDDADRPGEMEVLDLWKERHGVQVETVPTPSGAHAVVRVPERSRA
jgi:hypothetical protein